MVRGPHGLEIEYGAQASSPYSSIDEIIAAINSMGEPRIASRLEYLTSEEIVEEGDIPIGLHVCTAFFDFFTALKNDAYLNLTCAKGWLCAEWDFPDGNSVIVWFIGRDAARVTVFDSGDNLVDVNASQQVRDRSVIMKNLERSGYFSWRTKHFSDASLRTAIISPATIPSGKSETTDDHLQRHS